MVVKDSVSEAVLILELLRVTELDIKVRTDENKDA